MIANKEVLSRAISIKEVLEATRVRNIVEELRLVASTTGKIHAKLEEHAI